jgi:hypothetical protein
MDELFGVADFHGLEDVGMAAKHVGDGTDLEKSEVLGAKGEANAW